MQNVSPTQNGTNVPAVSARPPSRVKSWRPVQSESGEESRGLAIEPALPPVWFPLSRCRQAYRCERRPPRTPATSSNHAGSRSRRIEGRPVLNQFFEIFVGSLEIVGQPEHQRKETQP